VIRILRCNTRLTLEHRLAHSVPFARVTTLGTPSLVLEEHYLDYSPRKLKQIYDDVGLTMLE